MKVCGIVVEYNPFHNGHLYHLTKARELTNCDVLIAIMSPTFMQRGEPALINKFIRTKFALEYGVDLIVELPSVYAIQSANHFAAGALKILNELQINYLVFGSESSNLIDLQKAANISLLTDYQLLVKEYLQNGQRYATACNKAFEHYNIKRIDLANDILSLAYLQEIAKNNYSIAPLSIQRTNHYLSKKLHSDISSATAIRTALFNQQDITSTTPMAQYLINNQDQLVFLNDFFKMLKYQVNVLSINQIQELANFGEGLEYLFKKEINKAKDIDDFINRVSSKRYPKTRVQRLIVNVLCNIKQKDLSHKIDYIRVLGMNQHGQQYLKTIKKQTDYQVITSFSQHKSPILELEHKISTIYSLCKPQLNYLAALEYQQAVIIKQKSQSLI